MDPVQDEVEEASESPAPSLALEPLPNNPSAARPLLSVAPMMDWTDVHFRQLARLLSRRTWLWTEMVVDKTVLHTQNLDKHLWFPPEQRPLVLQLGGSDPALLAAAAAKAAEYGYDEINLNCGCPSDRVAGAGCFGAALMMQPELVARCMAAMGTALQQAADAAAAARAAGAVEGTPSPGPVPAGSAGSGSPSTPVPLTVKCRLGVDEVDSYVQLHEFVRVVSEGSPVRHFVIHARKAFLNGLSPHQNRTVPPLRHQWAWALARDFPHLQFSLNGGLLSCHDARAAILTAHPEVPYTRPLLPPGEPFAAAAAVCGITTPPTAASSVDSAPGAAPEQPSAVCSQSAPPAAATTTANGGGIEGVMIGRAAYNDPWGCLADADRSVFGEASNPAPSRRWVIQQYREYAEAMLGRWFVKLDGHCDPSVRTLMRPLLNLFHAEVGCKRWKNAVDELLRAGPKSVGEVLDGTLHLVPDSVLDSPPRQPDLAALSPFPLDPVLPSPTSRAGQNQNPPGSQPPRTAPAAARAAARSAARSAAGAAAGGTPSGDETGDASGGAVAANGGDADAAGEQEREEHGHGDVEGERRACCLEAELRQQQQQQEEEQEDEAAGWVGGVGAAPGGPAPRSAVVAAAAPEPGRPGLGGPGAQRPRRGCVIS